MAPLVAIVVLNWNNAVDTVACLDSLAQLDYPDAWIVVIDNGSSDDSILQIRAAHPDVTLIETGANLGYAGGNNVGIRQALAAGARVVCILNNDVIVEPSFFEPLVATLQSRPDVGIVTPLVAERTRDGGRVWALGATVNWRTAAVSRQHAGELLNLWQQQLPFETEIASGAAMLVKADVFERVGPLDEAFFLYYEETDWCLMAQKAGYRVLAVPSAIVWHKVSATLGTSSPVIDYYMLRNHLRFIGRHWHMPQRLYLQAKVVLRNLLTIAAFTVKPRGGARIPNRNARLYALRDAAIGRWGKMGSDVERVCYPGR